MKIGINASFTRKPYTGIAQYTFQLLEAMFSLPQAREHQFFLYFEDEKSAPSITNHKPARVTNIIERIVKTPFYKRDDLVRKTAWEKINLPAAAKKDSLHVFFTPYNSATSFPMIKHVITLHDVIWKVYEKDYLNNFRKNIYSRQTFDAIKKAAHLITVSEYSKKEIIKYLNIDPSFITVIKNGAADCFYPVSDQRKIQTKLEQLNINSPYLFYIGGFEKRKNLDFLLKAFKKMTENYANVLGSRKLVIAGEIWPNKDPLVTDVQAVVGDLGLKDKVILTGAVSNNDLVTLYNGADLFVFPSLYEGFGLPVLEAMACGCPVLASNRTAIPEIGQDAIEYFNPDREDELIQQLNRLLSDPVITAELSQKGRIRAKSFSWPRAAKKTLEILTSQQ
ncbi:MAG: glycosyltransferase family 1 protein [Patescibacteria group bacterium]|nr:glycosyltransferase family 4 protein [Patescibacteria group bacterium]